MTRTTKLIIAGCFFLVVLVLTYSNHFRNAFHFDDSHTIVNNNYIRDIGNIPLFFKDVTTSSSLPQNHIYRPVVTTLNAIDYWIGGRIDPFYFHLSIFLWYVVQSALMFFLFRNLLNLSCAHRWNSFIALFATAFYALHTANAETINYILARSDSFSTLCIVASLLLYQIPWTRRYYLYLLTMAVGILTKLTGTMFVPILFLYILFFEEAASLNDLVKFKNTKKLVNAFVKSIPATLLAVSLLSLNLFYMAPEKLTQNPTTRFDYFITQFFVITHYIGNFFLPLNLSTATDFKVISSITDSRVLWGLIAIIMLMVLIVVTFRSMKTRPISFGILWFFIALAPTSSFVPLYQIANSHRLFFPYIGLVLSVSWSIGLLLIKYEEVIQKKVTLRLLCPILATIIILAYAYGTYQRNRVWKTDESLWYDVTIKSPENGNGLMNYGLSQMEKGKYEVALQYYERALLYIPYYSFLHINLGILKNAMDKPVEAEKYFKNALNYDRNNPGSYYYYGKWLYEHKRDNEAKSLLEKGHKLSPGHVEMKELLDVVTVKQTEDINTRIKMLLRITDEKSTAENFLELSLAYYEGGFYNKCVDACMEALAIRPDYALVYNNMCSAYNRLGRYDEAIEACKRALEISPDFERARNNLRRALENKSK